MTEERDPKVSQRYRDLPGEEPPRALDQKILAAARRATDKPHAPLVVPAGRHRWYYSLAAAAILVLAIAVTLHVERQQPDPELAVPTAPIPAPAPAPQEQKAEAAPVPAQPRARQERRQAYTPDPPPAAPAAPPAAPAPEPLMKQQAEPRPSEGAMADTAAARRDDARVAREAQAPAAAASRSAPSPRSTTAPMAAQIAADTPEKELERIAELRAQGRDEEADKALAEFRKRYADYRIPEEMLGKVERRAAERRPAR